MSSRIPSGTAVPWLMRPQQIRPDYPLDTRVVLGALASGKSPALNGVVILRVPRLDAIHPQPVHTGGDSRGRTCPPGTPKLVDNPGWCRAARPVIFGLARTGRWRPGAEAIASRPLRPAGCDHINVGRRQDRDHIKVLRSPVSSGTSLPVAAAREGRPAGRPEGRDRHPGVGTPSGRRRLTGRSCRGRSCREPSRRPGERPVANVPAASGVPANGPSRTPPASAPDAPEPPPSGPRPLRTPRASAPDPPTPPSPPPPPVPPRHPPSNAPRPPASRPPACGVPAPGDPSPRPGVPVPPAMLGA